MLKIPFSESRLIHSAVLCEKRILCNNTLWRNNLLLQNRVYTFVITVLFSCVQEWFAEKLPGIIK